jgi:hypothetical protein
MEDLMEQFADTAFLSDQKMDPGAPDSKRMVGHLQKMVKTKNDQFEELKDKYEQLVHAYNEDKQTYRTNEQTLSIRLSLSDGQLQALKTMGVHRLNIESQEYKDIETRLYARRQLKGHFLLVRPHTNIISFRYHCV